jgi:hypothetical protein
MEMKTFNPRRRPLSPGIAFGATFNCWDYPIAKRLNDDLPGGLVQRLLNPAELEVRGSLLSDVIECIIDSALFGLALVLVEIGLELLFGFHRVNKKLPLRTESQFADVAICRARSAPDEPDDFKFAIGHRAIMAGRRGGVKCLRAKEPTAAI